MTTNETPIATAVLPLKSEAVVRAEQEARAIVSRVTQKLIESGNDLKVAAPYPHGGMSREEYMQVLSTYQLFSSLTTRRKSSCGMNEPILVDITPTKVERFVQEAKEDAAYNYDLFIAKLNMKIGACTSATLTGNHVWSQSILTATKNNGTKENWKTQMIVNCSKLGKLFNQFPTRKVK